MSVAIDQELAELILLSAIEAVKDEESAYPKSRFSEDIKAIILGSHLTFRYILLNGLLAKATEGSCNPICLQAGSSLPGAFDARSLCHSVVVPIEREYLDSRLGGSNEPFLNKPARFPELSLSNAMRRGEDTLRMEALIRVLNGLQDSDEACFALEDAIYFTLQRPSRNIMDYLGGSPSTTITSPLARFGIVFADGSMEGESCAILAGVTFELLGDAMSKELNVKVHPVTQSGSSSREISDIDVFDEDELIYTAEVKDKIFYEQDVDHAVSKVAITDNRQLIFLTGPRGKLKHADPYALQEKWMKQGFDLIFIRLIDFFMSAIAITPNLSREKFFSYVEKHAKAARAKDATYEHIRESSEMIGL